MKQKGKKNNQRETNKRNETTRKKQNTRAARVGCASAQTKGVAIRSRHSVKSRAHASTYRAAFEPGRARYLPPTAGIATASRTLVILRTRLVGSAPKDAIRVIFEPSSTRQMPYFSKRRAARERQRGPGGASSIRPSSDGLLVFTIAHARDMRTQQRRKRARHGA